MREENLSRGKGRQGTSRGESERSGMRWEEGGRKPGPFLIEIFKGTLKEMGCRVEINGRGEKNWLVGEKGRNHRRGWLLRRGQKKGRICEVRERTSVSLARKPQRPH